MFLPVYRWTKWGLWLAVRVLSGEAPTKPGHGSVSGNALACGTCKPC